MRQGIIEGSCGCAIWSLLLPLLAIGGAEADPDNYVDIVRGKALATAGDCVACHTVSGGTALCRRARACRRRSARS